MHSGIEHPEEQIPTEYNEEHTPSEQFENKIKFQVNVRREPSMIFLKLQQSNTSIIEKSKLPYR